MTSRAGLDAGSVAPGIGSEMYACLAELYPICRSITGDGVRATLARLNDIAPLTIHEVPSGTPVLDWTVPREWNIRDAWIKDSRGHRVIDFREHNLHVVSYSVPVHRRMSLEALRPHLFSLPDQPDRIPYRTSYYEENWGFCLSQKQLNGLANGDYEVCIDASLEPGSLTYGELQIAGQSDEEVLISSHICHPSLANDNLSGMVIAAFLAHHLRRQARSNRYSYRFLFVPATIGSITWLAQNESTVRRIRHGLTLACLGDSGPHTYKRSRRGNAEIDQACIHVLQQQGKHAVIDFSPYGYDERQYCSPGFNLPVGRLTRTPHGNFSEYHTSSDNLDFVKPAQLAESLRTVLDIIHVIENNSTYLNQKPHGEPQLGKYGLYDAIGGTASAPPSQMALLWVLNLSDGQHSLLDIAQRAGLPFKGIVSAAHALKAAGLLLEAV